MAALTPQFYNTSNRLIRDVTSGLGRDLKDAAWIGGFCLPMIGSLAHECGAFRLMEEGKPTVTGSLGGISFAQWTGMSPAKPGRGAGRRKIFMDLCRRLHLHPYSYDAAVAMILFELTGTAKGVVLATLRAPAVTEGIAIKILGEKTGSVCDRALLGRVIKFEVLYEAAGVKHYASRCAHAIQARDAYRTWAGQGFPELDKFFMPKARFSAQFDAEFGLGESETTTRASARSGAGGTVLKLDADVGNSAPRSAVLTDGEILTRTRVGMPTPTVRRGSWPEHNLSSAEVMQIQTRLRELGYVRVGMVNGVWGTDTTASIAALQAENGIEVDGHYGASTRTALMQGRKRVISPERQNATTKVLLAAGEPTMAAVQPVSIASKALGVASALGTGVAGIASIWPQASSTLDGLRDTFANIPGWVWPLLTLAVAVYFYLSSRNVKAVALDNFRTGASTALATALIQFRPEYPGAVLPAVPSAIDHDPEPAFEDALHIHDVYSPNSEAERPLGSDDDAVDLDFHPETEAAMLAEGDPRALAAERRATWADGRRDIA